MKINAIRAFIIASLIIILLYALGLFLPIIMTSKTPPVEGEKNKVTTEDPY
tara:strand:- start:216 stop:368 length:153 start_codon:yes stop_codon:yes gene_type:complete